MPPPFRIARNISRRVVPGPGEPGAGGIVEEVHAVRRHGHLPVVPGVERWRSSSSRVSPRARRTTLPERGWSTVWCMAFLHGSGCSAFTVEERVARPADTSRNPLPARPFGSLDAVAPSSLTVRSITPEQHLDFVRGPRSASFLQTPAWGRVKSEWRSESIGWFRGAELVGAGLVLYRQLPKVKRYLAYLPEGPVIDWADDDLAAWLTPMVAHLKGQGAFGVRMGPPVDHPPLDRRAGQGGHRERRRTPPRPGRPRGAQRHRRPGARRAADLGWQPQAVEGGFAAGQPQYNFVVPLRDADGNARTEDDVLKGMNQQWRRNIKKADKAGVEVTRRRRRRPQALPRPLRPHRRARRLHPASAGLLPDHGRRALRRGARPDHGCTWPATRATWSRPPSRSGSAATRGTPTAPPPPRSATSAAPTPCSGR